VADAWSMHLKHKHYVRCVKDVVLMFFAVHHGALFSHVSAGGQ
jgi:hypothetical protein